MTKLMKSKLVLVGFYLLSANAFAETFDVDCDGTGDRQAIQDAIDTASEHDKVAIHGSCLFDGERVVIDKSFLTISGDANDTDGDGKMDEWNTVLKGNGNVDNFLAGPYTNLGLHVGNVPATDDDIVGVTIENIRLQDFYLALTVSPGVLNEDNLRCDELQVTEARALHTRIQQNNFVNNSNHFFLYGAADNTIYDSNLTQGGGGIPLASATFVLSKKTICLTDSGASSVSIGTSNNYQITNSRFSGVGADFGTSDVELVNAHNSTIEGNDFEGEAQPIFLFGAINTNIRNNVMLDTAGDAVDMLNSQDTLVTDNFIQGAGFSGVLTLELDPGEGVVQILGLPGSKNNRIHCNNIQDTGKAAAAPAIVIVESTNHVAKNSFSSNALDVLLVGSDNIIISGPSATIVDLFGGNKLITNGKDSNCAPQL